MYIAVTENAGLKSVFRVRGCYLAHFKAENKLYPMHTPLPENEISDGPKANWSAKMTCAVGRAKSDQGGLIKSVKDGTWYTFGNLYETCKKCQGRDLVHFWQPL